jgi:hypothetical protein
LLTIAFGWREGATLCFLDILPLEVRGSAEFAPDREVRNEEIVPGARVLKVVPRPEVTFLDDLVVDCGARLLDLVDGREEMLGRGGGAALWELAPELRAPPLLFGADAGGDFLRFSLASDAGAVNTIAPAIIRSDNV